MPRYLTVAAAQMGPVNREDTREEVVERLLALLTDAHGRGAELVVFPELALTTFFPRYFIEDEKEIATWFETEMPGPATKPLFDQAAALGVGFSLGYAELLAEDDGVAHRHNTQILVERDGSVVGRYRKVHIPGHEHNEPWRPFQHLERYFFEPGNDALFQRRASTLRLRLGELFQLVE